MKAAFPAADSCLPPGTPLSLFALTVFGVICRQFYIFRPFTFAVKSAKVSINKSLPRSRKESAMAKLNAVNCISASLMGSYRVYAAFYYEGYFCCAKKEFPAVHRA